VQIFVRYYGLSVTICCRSSSNRALLEVFCGEAANPTLLWDPGVPITLSGCCSGGVRRQTRVDDVACRRSAGARPKSRSSLMRTLSSGYRAFTRLLVLTPPIGSPRPPLGRRKVVSPFFSMVGVHPTSLTAGRFGARAHSLRLIAKRSSWPVSIAILRLAARAGE